MKGHIGYEEAKNYEGRQVTFSPSVEGTDPEKMGLKPGKSYIVLRVIDRPEGFCPQYRKSGLAGVLARMPLAEFEVGIEGKTTRVGSSWFKPQQTEE